MLSRKFILSLTMSAACLAGSAVGVHAGDDNPPPPNGAKHRGGGGKGVRNILAHAADLNLTDDQKKQLEALADAAKDGTAKPEEMKSKVEAILTKDQLEKLKTLNPKHGDKKEGGDDKKEGGEKEKKDAPPAPAPGDDKK